MAKGNIKKTIEVTGGEGTINLLHLIVDAVYKLVSTYFSPVRYLKTEAHAMSKLGID